MGVYAFQVLTKSCEPLMESTNHGVDTEAREKFINVVGSCPNNK